MTAPADNAKPPSLAERMGPIRVGLRQDLDVSRHVFRGEPAYLLRDPLTFQSHRFSKHDYDIIVRLNAEQSLGDTFDELVAEHRLDEDDRERFYMFVFDLHRRGLLNLPVNDDKSLYRRFRARQNAVARQRITGWLFLRIPLWNPDSFLDRTMGSMQFMFTPAFFAFWCVLALAAGVVCFAKAGEIVQPAADLLAVNNLGLLWILLIGLKVFHEFGHAYACKHFGGHVPEMGAYLILGTPCAYVDATTSWSFTSKWQRLIVALGGMYFETLTAFFAVFVWALTGPGLVNAAAYNIMFLASVTTILFNANPLMRYDGYYIFSDLVEIPNLRARATGYVQTVFKRCFLGVRTAGADMSAAMKTILFSFGISASLYRIVVMAGIVVLLAMKLPLVGLAIGVYMVGMMVVGLGRKLFGYLWFAEETAAVRRRAIAISAVILIGLPTAVLTVPMRTHAYGPGRVERENESVLHAELPAFVQSSQTRPGREVAAGDVLMTLTNDDFVELLLETDAELEAARIRRDASRFDEPASAQQEEHRIAALQGQRKRIADQLASLTVAAPDGGEVVRCIDERMTGQFVQSGEPLATIVSGDWFVRVLLDEEQMAASEPRVGEPVVFRPRGGEGAAFKGSVVRVRPRGSRQVAHPTLTQLGTGDIAVDQNQQASRPFFEITVALSAPSARKLEHGQTGFVRFRARPESIGMNVYRRVARFLGTLYQS